MISDRVLVRANQLAKAQSGRVLWRDKSFSVMAGESLAVTGPSGSGKTTLLNCIGLLEKADSGDVEICGTEAFSLRRRARREKLRDEVGHLFQNYGLIENWTIDRNLDVAFIGKKMSCRERRDRRASALRQVGLEGAGHRRVHSLSGGEQQRTALARLVLKRPIIILADEPTAALDEENVRIVLSVLGELRDKGAAVVIATHDQTVVDWCDECTHLGQTSDAPTVVG